MTEAGAQLSANEREILVQTKNSLIRSRALSEGQEDDCTSLQESSGSADNSDGLLVLFLEPEAYSISFMLDNI